MKNSTKRKLAVTAGLAAAAGTAGVVAGVGLIAYATGKIILRAARTFDLKDKVVLITGGSRGLGLILAREFSKLGARVAICARDENELERARREFASCGHGFLALRCDLTHPGEPEQLVAEIENRWGQIDVLVNNAGTILVGPIENMSLQDFEEAMDVNFWGAVRTTMAAIPGMRTRRAGRIMNIASIGGKIAAPHLLPYTASKFALTGFSEGLHAELAKDGICVTTVCPGLMRTGSPRNANFKGKHEREYAWFMLGDSLPIVSIDAQHAARRIIRACIRGENEVLLGWTTKLAVAANGLNPGIISEILAASNRWLMPGPIPGAAHRKKGFESETKITQNPVTSLTRAAEAANNQI